MSRALPALIAVLLALAGVAPPAVGGVSTPQTQVAAPVEGVSSNTTTVLALDRIEESDFSSPGLSVTKAVSADASALESRFDAHAVEQRYLAASTEEAKRQVLMNATRRLGARVEALRARERAVRNAYLAGDVTAAEYVATLGKLDTAADGIGSALDRLVTLAGRESFLEPQVRNIRSELVTLQGPVRDRIAVAIHGGDTTGRLFIAASGTGTVLAIVDENEGVFVREAVRNDHFDGIGDAINITAARERFDTYYPWASSRENWRRFSIGFFGPDAYLLQIDHDHGTLTSYLDASTGTVYREIQTKTLDQLPVEGERTISEDNVTLAVSKTYPGGPLRVRVTNTTGASLDAQVAVNGTAVGRTGSAGALWTTSPTGGYPVRATHDGTTLQLNVTATHEG